MTIQRATELQRQAWQLQAEGRLPEAARACAAAIRLARAARGRDSVDVINLLNDLADIEIDRQHHRKALALAEKACRMLEHRGPPGDATTATVAIKTHTLLGTLRRSLGLASQACDDLRRAVDLAVRHFGHRHPESATAKTNLGVAYKFTGNFEAALALYGEALDYFVEVQKDGLSIEVASIHHNIGGLYHAMGDSRSAEAPSRRAWEISLALLGEDALQTILDSVAHAAVLDDLGRHDEAQARYLAAYPALQSALGPNHVDVLMLEHNLAAALAAGGRPAEAETYFRQALDGRVRQLGASSIDAAITRIGLAGVLNQLGQFAAAQLLLEEARETLLPQIASEHKCWRVLESHLSAARAGAARSGSAAR